MILLMIVSAVVPAVKIDASDSGYLAFFRTPIASVASFIAPARADRSVTTTVVDDLRPVVIVGTVVENQITNFDPRNRVMSFPVRYQSGHVGTEDFATRTYHARLTEKMLELQQREQELKDQNRRLQVALGVAVVACHGLVLLNRNAPLAR